MKEIMVVDDEKDFLYEMKKILEKEGFSVITAESGPEALETLKDNKPDLILLDVMMPEMSGWEVAKKIKKEEDTKNIPITMPTVRNSLDDKIQRLEGSGADWHISKPADRTRFIDTVKWLLENPPKSEVQ
jgi:two-component system alkaline phosphatase synthesis response regulator PhoP